MDIYDSLNAELYFWGDFGVLQNAAEQFAKNRKVYYQTILEEKVEHHLHTALDRLPLDKSLKEAIEEWFYTVEPFSKNCPDWNAWYFPDEENAIKEKEYLVPVMRLCKLAVDAFDITSDYRLCRPNEEHRIHFARFGCVPPNLLGATRYAMKKDFEWDGKNFTVTSNSATRKFQAHIQRGLADAHVHLLSSACFTDLLYAAIQSTENYGRPRRNEHDLRPLLLACKAMLAAFLEYVASSQNGFRIFWDNLSSGLSSGSERFWHHMLLATQDPSSKSANFLEDVDAILKKLKKSDNYEHFFEEGTRLEKHWFMIVRYVLDNQQDESLYYHFTLLTCCICNLYSPMSHRNKFSYSYHYLYQFIRGIRKNKRTPTDVPLKRVGYESMRNRCEYLQRAQLRISIEDLQSVPREHARKLELLEYLKTYQTYLEEQKGLEYKNCEVTTIAKCSHCETRAPLSITFPIHFLRHEPTPEGRYKLRDFFPEKARETFRFGIHWDRMESLTAMFLDQKTTPAFQYFFGRMDVAGNEDKKPHWVFALLFQELEDRLKKINQLNAEGEEKIPRIRYTCHAGENFHSSIQGLRRIWEPIIFFPHLDSIGHALALDMPDHFPGDNKMPADELLDDLVWVLSHRDHILDVSCREFKRIEHFVGEIVEKTYGKKFERHSNEDKSFRKPIDDIFPKDLETAYHWRFNREKIKQYIKVLSYDNRTGKYSYEWDFNLPPDEDYKPLPKAAKILQKYFTQKRVADLYTLSKELRTILKKCYPSLRDFVKQKIIERNIVIEVCPTSNFRIGGLTRMVDHPLFAMACPQNVQKDNIRIVFGSDDPAIFQSAIDDEYLYVKESMGKKYRCLSQAQQLKYLDKIRCRSMKLCCDDLPNDPNKILNLIESVLPREV